jgi:hypothetical protein
MTEIQPTTARRAPSFPAQQASFAAFQLDLQAGPDGFQFVALNSTQVLGYSGWHADAGVAWAALGHALGPMILRTANSAVS